MLLIVLLHLKTNAQMDQFNEEEAEHFRSLEIVPLIDREQDGDYYRMTYLIPHDITIPRGKVLTLYPGSTLLFKKDTRLIVKGSVIAKGNESNPVLFCKLENSDYYTPLDSIVDTKWDGIIVKDSGRLEFQYTHISNSKYGITHEGPTGDIVLDSVQFYENRYSNFKVAQKEIQVTPCKNFFFQANGNLSGTRPAVDVSFSVRESPEMPPAEVSEKSRSMRKFRAAMWTGVAAGGLIGVSGHLIHKKYYKSYNDVEKNPPENPVDMVTKYRKLSKIGEGMRIGGTGLAGLSVIGLTISFAF
jgi:hypothetical protein